MARTNNNRAGMSTENRSNSFSSFQEFPTNTSAQSWQENSTSRSSNGLALSPSNNSTSEDAVETSVAQSAKSSPQACLNSRPGSSEDEASIQTPMHIPKIVITDPEVRRLLCKAPREPPVTTNTLSELELGSIMNNIYLRSDVNFDNDLHFMPIKGERGEDKRKKAKNYWKALAAELEIRSHTASTSSVRIATCDETFKQRLPTMFSTLKELLVSLVPDRDHPSIAQHLDIPFIMQQISKGVLNIASLARWLAKLLKCHCAPMRDGITDHFAALIEQGLQQHDMGVVVNGLEQLFAVLEAMKLDVANHQIRTFRLLLIDDTEQFQRDHFERLIRGREFDPLPSGEWYWNWSQQLTQGSADASFESAKGMMPLIVGLVSSLVASSMPGTYPRTFYHDQRRLTRLRDDIQDIVHLNICFSMFHGAVCDVTRGQPFSVPDQAFASLRLRIFAILEHSERPAAEGTTAAWQKNIDNIALEIVRTANVWCNHDSKWHPTLSVTELPTIPDEQVQMTRLRLHEAMKTEEYQRFANSIKLDVISNTAYHASRFNSFGARGISEEQRVWISRRSLGICEPVCSSGAPSRTVCLSAVDVEDIARRLAHMVVLNWRIWANLCYVPYYGKCRSSTRRQGDLTVGKVDV